MYPKKPAAVVPPAAAKAKAPMPTKKKKPAAAKSAWQGVADSMLGQGKPC
jgi:hypothetical protein